MTYTHNFLLFNQINVFIDRKFLVPLWSRLRKGLCLTKTIWKSTKLSTCLRYCLSSFPWTKKLCWSIYYMFLARYAGIIISLFKNGTGFFWKKKKKLNDPICRRDVYLSLPMRISIRMEILRSMSGRSDEHFLSTMCFRKSTVLLKTDTVFLGYTGAILDKLR